MKSVNQSINEIKKVIKSINKYITEKRTIFHIQTVMAMACLTYHPFPRSSRDTGDLQHSLGVDGLFRNRNRLAGVSPAEL